PPRSPGGRRLKRQRRRPEPHRLISSGHFAALQPRRERPAFYPHTHRRLEFLHRSPLVRVDQKLRPYGIRPMTIRIGEEKAKGYLQEDFLETFRRYITKSDLDLLSDSEDLRP